MPACTPGTHPVNCSVCVCLCVCLLPGTLPQTTVGSCCWVESSPYQHSQTGHSPTEKDLGDLNFVKVRHSNTHSQTHVKLKEQERKKKNSKAIEVEEEDFPSVLLPLLKCSISSNHICFINLMSRQEESAGGSRLTNSLHRTFSTVCKVLTEQSITM